MKKLVLTLLIAVVSQNVMAKDLRCNNEVIKKTVIKNYKKFGVNTSSCGAKLIYKQDDVEAYVVCTTDETEGSEYIAVLADRTDKKTGKVVETCAVQSITYAGSEQTNFEDGQGEFSRKKIVSTIECEIDYSDAKLICNKAE